MKQSLLHLDGVTKAVVELAEGWATFTLAPETNLDPEAVYELVQDAGMSLYGIQIEAKGEMIDQQGQLALRVSGTQQVFPLQQNARAAQLAQALKAGHTQVTVTGTLPTPRDGAPAALIVENFQLH